MLRPVLSITSLKEGVSRTEKMNQKNYDLQQQIQSLSEELSAMPSDLSLMTGDERSRIHEVQMELTRLDVIYNHRVYGITCREDVEVRNRLNITLAKLLGQPRRMIRALQLSLPELKKRIEKIQSQQKQTSVANQISLL